MKPNNLTRRRMLQGTAAGALGMYLSPMRARAADSPNEKLNIAVVGVANRAEANLHGVAGQNVVVICDVDENYLAKAKESFPKAETARDFRKVVERKDIDAVVVSTPDHTHAPATLMALRAGKHVYCEKPMTHTVHEARLVAQTAAKMKRATQLGTQIHAMDNYRRVVELVQAGAIGPIREAHCWVGRSWSGGDRPKETPPVPKNLDWDLWLGPAPVRPYHPTYVPFHWRKWWDFGGGTLADMGCHHMDLAFWALGLRHPTRVEAKSADPPHPETATASLRVEYQFPARGGQPPVTLTWHDGDLRPKHFEENLLPKWGDGTLFVGEKGMLLADYGGHVLLPRDQFKDYKRPEPSIPSSIGHYEEWIQACKDGSQTTCNFDYSGALTEAVLLGVVSYRAGCHLDWDAEQLKATNCSAADNYIRREYRKGWEI